MNLKNSNKSFKWNEKILSLFLSVLWSKTRIERLLPLHHFRYNAVCTQESSRRMNDYYNQAVPRKEPSTQLCKGGCVKDSLRGPRSMLLANSMYHHPFLHTQGLLLPLYNDKKEVAYQYSGVIRGKRSYFLSIISDIMLSAPQESSRRMNDYYHQAGPLKELVTRQCKRG